MRWALIAPALLLAGTSLGEPAHAFWPLDAVTGVLSAPFRAFSYHRYYRRSAHHGHSQRVTRRSEREAAAGHESDAAGAIKSGLWEFRDRLVAASSGAAAPGKGGLTTTRVDCVNPANFVPVELGPQCRLDASRRDGPTITWSMSCSNARNTVRSDGTAQYHGETMTATMTSHLPVGKGEVSSIAQRITGRYLGACVPSPQIATTRPWTVPGSGGAARSGEPPSRPGAADAARPGGG